MTTQPEALRLADALETQAMTPPTLQAAAELRRLHEAHDWQYKMAGDRLRRIEKLERLNQELLEVLRTARDHIDMTALEISHCKDAEIIRAAIAKATGEQA